MVLMVLARIAKRKPPRPLKKMKSIFFTVAILLKIYKDVKKDRLRNRDAQLVFFDRFIKIYD